jgi:NADPH2:quinone reductase
LRLCARMSTLPLRDEPVPTKCCAPTGGGMQDIGRAIKALTVGGAVDHVVEVAFDANIDVDTEVLAVGGSICAYATVNATPAIPFWPLLFKNIRFHFIGSDDFPPEVKLAAAQDLNRLCESGWPGFTIDRAFALEQAALAHEHLESKRGPGRVVLVL